MVVVNSARNLPTAKRVIEINNTSTVEAVRQGVKGFVLGTKLISKIDIVLKSKLSKQVGRGSW